MPRIINIMSQVSQQGSWNPKFFGHLDRLADTEMRLMLSEAQGINNQHLQPLEKTPGGLGQGTAIDDVSQVANPVAQRFTRTMQQGNRYHGLTKQVKRAD